MALQIEYRSFRSDISRPTPHIENDAELGFFAVVTPWGSRSTAERVTEIIKDYLVSLRADQDATSPFPRLTSLSSNANNLRIAALIANEKIYREENDDYYNSAVEIFALSIEGNEVSWIQFGHPNVFLKRQNKGLVALGSHLDLPMDVKSKDGKILPPLPSTVLGLDSSTNFLVGSFISQDKDQLVMVSRSHLPISFYQINDRGMSMRNMTQALVDDNAEMAFWLGSLLL